MNATATKFPSVLSHPWTAHDINVHSVNWDGHSSPRAVSHGTCWVLACYSLVIRISQRDAAAAKGDLSCPVPIAGRRRARAGMDQSTNLRYRIDLFGLCIQLALVLSRLDVKWCNQIFMLAPISLSKKLVLHVVWHASSAITEGGSIGISQRRHVLEQWYFTHTQKWAFIWT